MADAGGAKEGGGEKGSSGKEYYMNVINEVREARPELLSVIRRVVEYLDSCNCCEFTPLDVVVPPGKLNALADAGFLVKTGRYKYRVEDCQAAREAVEEALGAGRPRRRQGPAFDVTMDMFEGIAGYEQVKRMIVMALRARGPVHVLLVGPPGLGKSLFLDSVREALESMGECVAQVEGGKGLTTSTGIVEVVLRMPQDRPCVLLIDELDKMGKDDMAALYRLMATGEIVVAKHRTYIRERRDVWVIAASNRENAIPKPILSRFMIVRFRQMTEDEYKRIVPAILVKREGVDEELAKYIAEKLAPITRDPRDAIRIARMAWSKEDVDYLVSLMTSRVGVADSRR